VKKRFIDLMICFGLGVFLFFLSHNVYADVYEVSIPITILTSYFIITIIDLIRKRSYTNKNIRIFTIILLVSSLLFIFITKPNITYKQGKDLIISNNYTNVRSLDDKSILSFNLERNYFINNAYLYIAEKNNVTFYVLVGPIDEEVETFDFNGDNYINKYFELYEG
jgi:hypothetical protein